MTELARLPVLMKHVRNTLLLAVGTQHDIASWALHRTSAPRKLGNPSLLRGEGHSNNVSTECLLFLKRSPLEKIRVLLGVQRSPGATGSLKKRGSSLSCQKLSPNRNKLKTTETIAPSPETSNTVVLGSTQTPQYQTEKFTARLKPSVKPCRVHLNCKCSFAGG